MRNPWYQALALTWHISLIQWFPSAHHVVLPFPSPRDICKAGCEAAQLAGFLNISLSDSNIFVELPSLIMHTGIEKLKWMLRPIENLHISARANAVLGYDRNSDLTRETRWRCFHYGARHKIHDQEWLLTPNTEILKNARSYSHEATTSATLGTENIWSRIFLLKNNLTFWRCWISDRTMRKMLPSL